MTVSQPPTSPYDRYTEDPYRVSNSFEQCSQEKMSEGNFHEKYPTPAAQSMLTISLTVC